MRFALVSPMRADTSSADVASPHISLCLPTVHISPRWTKAAFSSAVVRSKSSSFTVSPLFVSNKSAISASSKPVRPRSKPRFCNSSISTDSNSSSQPASNAIRLSARIYAFFCASVRWSAYTQGTSAMPSSFAAMMRPCPASTLYSRSIMTGFTKPNSRREERSFRICSLLWVLALFAYGTNLLMSTS